MKNNEIFGIQSQYRILPGGPKTGLTGICTGEYDIYINEFVHSTIIREKSLGITKRRKKVPPASKKKYRQYNGRLIFVEVTLLQGLTFIENGI